MGLTELKQRVDGLVAKAPDESDFTSTLRSPAVAARVGLWLGISFGICFLTGLISHQAQSPDPIFAFPTRPVWMYQFTQGLHVTAGVAAVPLLLVKLWAVFPKLFARPQTGLRHLTIEVLERGSIAVLVASSIFQLITGIANSAQWYPWTFDFRGTHYALAWIAIGALIVHIAVKLPIIRDALGSDIDDQTHDRASAQAGAGEAQSAPPLTRRGLVRSAYLAAGVAVLATAGSTVPVLRKVSVFAVRDGDGPGGLPVNKSARAAKVVAKALNPEYQLTVVNGDREITFTRDELSRLEQRTHDLPIACVEGWSATGTWTGVRLRDLLDEVGAPRGRAVTVTSLQTEGPYRITSLPEQFADDPLTLLALGLNGEPLALDHGYPCRLIAPNRPGVLQTKWVARVEVQA